jgi:hypothetical protein
MRVMKPVVVAAAGLLITVFGTAEAALQRNPTGVNVSASGPTTLTIRFADDAGQRFTSTEAIFCSVDPTAGAGSAGSPAGIRSDCVNAGGRVLGRLPSALDRGSTTSARSSITDVMTIPFSVTRRAVIQARTGAKSDFFYVRRFVPTAGTNIGFGVNSAGIVVVTCRLTAGTARTPLSLTRVVLYGSEPDRDRILQIRVNRKNIKTGVVKADIRYTGTGILSGWWEVRRPSDPPLRDIDLFAAGSLSETDRQRQQRFTRVKRFRFQVPVSGRLTLPGPRYSQLPDDQPGFYQVLLRIEATRDREALSNLAIAGGSARLFSGGAAGFRFPPLEYRVGDVGATSGAGGAFRPRLIVERLPEGLHVALSWKASELAGPLVLVEATNRTEGTTSKLLVPMTDEAAVLPRQWFQGADVKNWRFVLKVLGRDKQPIGAPIELKSP